MNFWIKREPPCNGWHLNYLRASLLNACIPPAVPLSEAAAQPKTLRFTLWGAAIVLPIVLAYIIYSYSVFRGKVTEEKYYESGHWALRRKMRLKEGFFAPGSNIPGDTRSRVFAGSRGFPSPGSEENEQWLDLRPPAAFANAGRSPEPPGPPPAKGENQVRGIGADFPK